MFKFCVFLAFCIASRRNSHPSPRRGCYEAESCSNKCPCVCSAAPGGGTYCGETPREIFTCLSAPPIVSTDVTSKCPGTQYNEECDRITCVFREAKWLNGNAVDKTKVTAYLDQFEKDHAEWGPAIQHAKTTCLGAELKAQGIFLNCPAYDVMHCVSGSFIKHATPSQWTTSTTCSYPRAYAAACPVCPNDCFAPQVPLGSCNACYSQPRTP